MLGVFPWCIYTTADDLGRQSRIFYLYACKCNSLTSFDRNHINLYSFKYANMYFSAKCLDEIYFRSKLTKKIACVSEYFEKKNPTKIIPKKNQNITFEFFSGNNIFL